MRNFIVFLLSTIPALALGDWEVNLPRGVTPTSILAYDLHMLIFYITVIIGIGVFGVMFYSIIHHRKSKGAVPANFHENTKVEIIWTVIPFLILVGMAIPATQALILMEDTSEAEVTLKVTGYQWMWKYEYLEDNVSFLSRIDSESNKARKLNSGVDVRNVKNYLLEVDNPIVLPINAKIRLLLTASDVIHAWWVPELGGKKDAVPGFVNEMWFNINKPGIYRGQCAELCGKDHAFMPIVVKAVSKAEYEKWVMNQQNNNKIANKK
jgi:cytochrome c oxidase subunit 2